MSYEPNGTIWKSIRVEKKLVIRHLTNNSKEGLAFVGGPRRCSLVSEGELLDQFCVVSLLCIMSKFLCIVHVIQ